MVAVSEIPSAVYAVFVWGDGKVYVRPEDAARTVLAELHLATDNVSVIRYATGEVEGGDVTAALFAVMRELPDPPFIAPSSSSKKSGGDSEWRTATVAWRDNAVATIAAALSTAPVNS